MLICLLGDKRSQGQGQVTFKLLDPIGTDSCACGTERGRNNCKSSYEVNIKFKLKTKSAEIINFRNLKVLQQSYSFQR
jgi:hypothetical protein